jgi:hypothetical protein
MDKWKSKWSELFGIDIRSLALFRIGLAVVILGDLLIRIQDLKAHYSDEGVLPRSFLIQTLYPWSLSIHLISGNWQIQLILFILTAIFATALLVGYKTRLATILTWFLVMSLQLRNPMVDQGGDILLKVLLFWSMFLPLGAYWSIDQQLSDQEPPANQIVSAGTVALLLQVCFVYWFSALLKIDDTWIKEGSAIWYALSIEQYATPLGLYLLNYPGLLKVLTFSTFYLEAFGPFFAFSPVWTGPLRFATVVVFSLFHLLGLNLTMELAHFPYLCAVAWLVFIPSWFWDRLLKKGEYSPAPWKASWISNLLASFFLLYVFVWNISTLEFSWLRLSPPLEPIGTLLALDQTWNMFAPSPITLDGWYVIPGHLRNGKEVNLFTDGGPISWEKPASVAATYKNDRWRSYLMNIVLEEEGQFYLPFYAEYLCRNWNENHPSDQQLLSLDIFYMMKINDIKGPPPVPEKTLLWHHECFDSNRPSSPPPHFTSPHSPI